jgi:hypothetical protein
MFDLNEPLHERLAGTQQERMHLLRQFDSHFYAGVGPENRKPNYWNDEM